MTISLFQGGSILNIAAETTTAFDIIASSTLASAGWETNKLVDNNLFTSWSSGWIDEKKPNHTESLLLDLRAVKKVTSVFFQPRQEMTNFPADFMLVYSFDGQKLIQIPGQSYTNYKILSNGIIEFKFDTPVVAKFVGIYVTKRSADGNGNYLVQMSEAKVDMAAATDAEITASTAAANSAQGIKDPNAANTSSAAASTSTGSSGTSGTVSQSGSASSADGNASANGKNFVLTTSSVLKTSGWETDKMLDNNPATAWSSAWLSEKSPVCLEWIQADYKSVKKVESITIKPEAKSSCFPADFKFQSSFDASTWLDIPEAVYTDYKANGTDAQVFKFKAPVVAQYVRIYITKRTANPDGNYLVQIAEFSTVSTEATQAEIDAAKQQLAEVKKPIPFTVTASSTLESAGWELININDGNPTTPWSSGWTDEKNPVCEEWVALDAGSIMKYTSVSMTPITDLYCFPCDFKFQYSMDGATFIDIPGASYTGYTVKEVKEQVFTFKTPVVAEFIRVFVTKRSPDGGGNYLVQMSEISALADAATESEISAAKADFEKASGTIIDQSVQSTLRNDLPIAIAIYGVLGLALIIMVVLFILRKKKCFILIGGACIVLLSCFTIYVSMSFEYELAADIGAGTVIYEPTEKYGYRYGPTMFFGEDGKLNAWFSAPGSGSEWDYLKYKSSTDYGVTWSGEIDSVKPTENSRDQLSTCDPGAFKIGDYYYISYTSTINPDGKYNDCYAARAKSPEGPWEKWNGTGWGGDPQPYILYGSDAYYYGIGEPSIVVVGNKLYVYYTYIGELENGVSVDQTMLAIGDAKDANWPRTLKSAGAVINRGKNEDSTDVKYVDAYKMFIAVSTKNRFTATATIKMYSSTDGIHFNEMKVNAPDVKKYCHNAGITGTESGHFDAAAKNYVGYAYGKTGLNWGCWSTNLDPVTITKTKTSLNLLKPVKRFFKPVQNDAEKNYTIPLIDSLSKSSDQRSANMAMDGNTKTIFASNLHECADYNEWILFQVDGSVKGVTVTPRANLLGFPASFTFEWSNDGLQWTAIEGAEYSNYILTDNQPISFLFKKAIKAKAVRMKATKLTKDEFDSYVFQLAEISAIK